MRSLLRGLWTVLMVVVGMQVSWAQSSDELRMQAFAQGRANNCVPIAFIKAAIHRYGLGQVFDTVRVANGVQVILRDKTKLVITDAERKQAAVSASFKTPINALPLAERTAVLKYADLCYSVMAKFIQQRGYYECLSYDNVLAPAKKLRKGDFKHALALLSNTGLCGDSGYLHLGLAVTNPKSVELPKPAPDFQNKNGIVVYSSISSHALFVLNHEFDDHGKWIALTSTGQWPANYWFVPEWYLMLK